MTYPNRPGTQAEGGPRLLDGDFVNGNGLAGGQNRTARQITALAGGAAPGFSATGAQIAMLASAINEVNVVATANDSTQAPSAQGNQVLDVINSSANPMRIYSNARTPTDTLNGTAGTTPYVLAAGKACRLISSVAGKWFINLSA